VSQRLSRLIRNTTFASRVIALAQIVCVVVGFIIVVQLWRMHAVGIAVSGLAIVIVGAMLTLYDLMARKKTDELTRSVVEQRQLSATLEHAVASRTVELEDAQRVLQRMWWLGQQITLELNPQRVLERFLEAVMDIAQADGAVVGLVGDDAKIRIVVGAGSNASLVGTQLPIMSSVMGRVIRTGVTWSVEDITEHAKELNQPLYERVKDDIKGLAILPIARRGERIGAVALATKERHLYGSVDLERIESMADLLSVALENAELVETLRQAEWRFRTLFRAAPDAVFTVLQSGRIREANDAVRDVTGNDSYQVIGRPVIDLVIPGDRDRFRAALDSAFAGTPSRLEVAFEYEGRSRRIVALAMSRLPEADPPTVLLVGRDMTSEREMRVRLMESDRLAAVGELVAGVAHEVNNPLSSISAFAQLMLRDGGLTPSQHDSIEVIKSETLRASQVVKDLLAFARRSEPQREPVDVNSVVSRTLRLRGYQLASNKITVETDLGADLPAVVGDARQLQQVCLNLVTNAIQAMTQLGGGTLFMSTRHEDGKVILDARDTGPGIAESARGHIFEPFFTTKGEGEGTGLGLSVSYGIVSAHGGTIELASTSNAGTTFRVSLPAAAHQATDDAVRESGPYVLRSPLAGIRLLFVDDEASLRSGMQAFGEMRGFTVVAASGGIEALDLVRAAAVDVVVCDLRMPGMDGVAFYERLRRERPGLASRTVFITGDVVSAGRITNLQQPVLTKPFAFEKLEEALVTLMRGSAARSARTPAAATM
jgi:two-component system NtrC family sensor kinase